LEEPLGLGARGDLLRGIANRILQGNTELLRRRAGIADLRTKLGQRGNHALEHQVEHLALLLCAVNA